MIVSDKNLIKSSKLGVYPNIHCLYSAIPREIRMHMYRVSRYAQTFLEEIYKEGCIRDFSFSGSKEETETIFRLHDIGRHYISIEIYNKVEALTPEEQKEIERHTLYALQAEKSVFFPFLPEDKMQHFRDVAVSHHERWDGKGYPHGFMGEEIPFLARVCAIADSYDGMVSWKPYKDSLSSGQAMEVIKKESGRQFQPELAEVFQKCKRQMETLDVIMGGK